VITTKYIEVDRVIITADDIRNLAELLKKAISAVPASPADPTYRFVLVGTDGTRWSSDSEDVLGPAGPLTTDRVRTVRLDAYIKEVDEATEYSISIQISHGGRYYADEQDIVISGRNQDWVRSTYQAFEEYLPRLEPQSAWGNQRRRLAVFLFWLGFMVTVLTAGLAALQLLVLLLPPEPEEAVRDGWFAWLGLIGIVGAGASLLVIDPFSRMLQKTFPNVELRIGPTHGQASLQKRKVLNFVMTMIVLPLSISILASVVLAVFT
jgi:hypothetical protein